MCVCAYIIHTRQLLNLLPSVDILGLGFGMENRTSFLDAIMVGLDKVVGLERSTSITMSQRSRASNPSKRNPASREIISDSVELCETELCFLHIQLTGTHVLLPRIHRTPPEVDFESSRSPAKSGSWNRPNLQCCACFPHDNLSEIVCVMNGRNHSCLSSVTCLSPFCDCSRKFIDGTKQCLVLQFVPSTSISIRFVSKLLTILQLIRVPA